jgi:hypothetical protein
VAVAQAAAVEVLSVTAARVGTEIMQADKGVVQVQEAPEDHIPTTFLQVGVDREVTLVPASLEPLVAPMAAVEEAARGQAYRAFQEMTMYNGRIRRIIKKKKPLVII